MRTSATGSEAASCRASALSHQRPAISHLRSDIGFTTLELLVVLVILVIMSAVVVVSMGPAVSDARARSGCRMVASVLSYARSYAVTNRADTRVAFATAGNGFSVETVATNQNGEIEIRPVTTQSGRFHRMPHGIEIVRVSKPGIDEEERWVSFTQLGQAEDADILIVGARGRERIVSLDGITGRCRVLQPESNENTSTRTASPE